MKRSPGVTAAAVVMMIGGSLFLLMAALTGAVLVLGGPRMNNLKGQGPMIALGLICYLAGGAFGLITGAGLLKLREWARVATLIFSGFGIMISIFMLAVFLLMPIPPSPQATPQFMFTFRLITSLIVLVPASTSLWWLIYFLTAGAKAQFAGEFVEGARGLPMSMKIIGWYLLIASVFTPIGTLQYGLGVFLIWILHPPASYAWSAVLAIWGIFSGIGLLKRRRWGWNCTVAFQIFGLISLACTAAKPEMMTRIMAAVAASNPNHAIPPFAPSVNFVRVVMGFSLALTGVILWFLVARRFAFAGVNGDPNAIPSEDRAI
jgi:hypothetical protein